MSTHVLLASCALLLSCSCNSAPSGMDGSASDLSASSPDLVADRADLSTTRDLAQVSDLAEPRDLATRPPDLAAFVCYDPGSSFPGFSKACMADRDCFAGIHQIDCCGSHAAYGLSESDRKAFDAAEAAFRVVCPANCRCVARPTVCDDGKTAPEVMITVSCDQGRCQSHGL